MELQAWMTLKKLTDDSSENSECFMGLCDWIHCATSPNVPCGQGFELGVTTFGKWDSNSATMDATHFYTRMAETPSFLDVILSDNLGYI